MDWIQSVQRALNYIEANILDEKLDNDTVAKQAYSSSANFQRIFSIVAGVTIADYIRSRRLTLAGKELADSNIKVIDTALKYCYETPDSFAKAFARFHGITPSEARNNPNSLKSFSPIFLRIDVQGGFNMNTKMISNLLPIANAGHGENYHFNGVARYVMGCLGEMTLADYSLIAGITGDSFTQFYPLGGGNFKGDSASAFYLGLQGYASVFEKLGYSAESFTEREFQSDYEHYVKKITASIDRGIPVIWHRRGPAAAIVGYETDGGAFLYLNSMSKDQTKPERLVLAEKCFKDDEIDSCGWTIVNKKTRDVSLKEIYRNAIINLPKLLTMKTDEFIFGAGAFRAWADDIEKGKFSRMSPDKFTEDYFTYEVYVVNAATNSGGCQSFLEKAQELNPDFAFLEEVRKQYRITNYLWNSGYWIKDVHSPEEREKMKRLYGDYNLETLGGAFGCKHETLQDEEKRALIVKQIRRFADCIDEVVRVLDENL